MTSSETPDYWIRRFLLGIALLIAAGMGIFARLFRAADPLGLATFLPGLWGFYLAFTSITPLVRFVTLQARTRSAWSRAAAEAFARASLPRRIYYLLAAVAEVDGPMTPEERETVRHFLLERFLDPVHVHEIQTWEAQPLAVEDRVGLAARIATGLDASELDSLFCWCCLVAFADGRFHDGEHRALQDVAKGLSMPPTRARMLFHLARAQYLGGSKHGQRTRPAETLNARAQALAVLGLAADASPEQIRRRHRELVRRFHPDTQPNLGPVAQREATERFTEIQRAYETLRS
ncbi:MAG TPA: DnaJ domain-containing protein [Planctomycetota bacterium]|nr:DnaJ domain-containing protein [Planctomycetota bacterium]